MPINNMNYGDGDIAEKNRRLAGAFLYRSWMKTPYFYKEEHRGFC